MSSDADSLIRELARRQHRLVSAAQLRSLGISPGALAHRVAAKRLLPVFNGVYLVGVDLFDHHTFERAAVLYAGDGAALTGENSLAARGVVPQRAGFATVAARRQLRRWVASNVPVAETGRPGHVRFIRCGPLQAVTESVGGMRVTSVPRALVDLAATRPRLVEHAWREADFKSLIDVAALGPELRRRRAGTARIRRLLEGHTDIQRGAHGFDSLAELEAVKLLVADGDVPPFKINHPIVAAGRPYRLDIFFEFERLAAEIDGWQRHGMRDAFEEDRLRDSDLRTAGITTARFSVRKVRREPQFFVARLKTELAQRRHELQLS